MSIEDFIPMYSCDECGAELFQLDHLHPDTGATYCNDCWEEECREDED